MDKEAPEIKPTTLDGQGENAVKTIDSAATQAAASAANENKEDYYVDPLEQDNLMKQKKQELEAAAEKDAQEAAKTANESLGNEEIRPDMNVTGFFSAGETAKKGSIMKRPVSSTVTRFFFAVSIVSVAISVIYAVALIASLYSVHWLMGWLYGIFLFASLISIIFAIRSLNSMSDQIKKYAILDLVFTGISVIPLLMLLANAIFKLA